MTEASEEKTRLDDLMLAMDVVDTLRHGQLVVQRELDSEGRERALIQRLREIYAAQGIDVPDRVLAEGVAALEENRFAYSPPAPGFAVSLAKVYVSRGKWGWPALAAVFVAIVLYVGYGLFVSGPEQRRLEAMPQELASERDAVIAVAQVEDASAQAQQLYSDGVAALRDGDVDEARERVSQLTTLRNRLEREYVVQVVARPNQPSGVWRIPDINPNARNYYLIVEAVTADGEVLSLEVSSEEDGETKVVDSWGLRVDERVFESVAADKRDDGIIQKRRVGTKRRGRLAPDYLIPTTGAVITNW